MKRLAQWRWLFILPLCVSVLANAILVVLYFKLRVEVAFAAEEVSVFISVASTREREDAVDYVSTYYLPDTKLAKDSPLSELVEDVRSYVLSQLSHEEP